MATVPSRPQFLYQGPFQRGEIRELQYDSAFRDPQVYLIPVGLDRMFYPDSNLLESRSWRVLDQRIPTPLAITPSQLADSGWQPFTGSTSGYFEEARRYPAFRAYPDAGGYSNAEMLASSRLVGRSIWNTPWALVIAATRCSRTRPPALIPAMRMPGWTRSSTARRCRPSPTPPPAPPTATAMACGTSACFSRPIL